MLNKAISTGNCWDGKKPTRDFFVNHISEQDHRLGLINALGCQLYPTTVYFSTCTKKHENMRIDTYVFLCFCMCECCQRPSQSESVSLAVLLS